MRRKIKEIPYAQAERRMFEAADLPVDILKFKHNEKEVHKLLKHTSKERKEANKEVTKQLLLRMNKTKPLEERKAVVQESFSQIIDTEMQE